jgi:hypothetical protein
MLATVTIVAGSQIFPLAFALPIGQGARGRRPGFFHHLKPAVQVPNFERRSLSLKRICIYITRPYQPKSVYTCGSSSQSMTFRPVLTQLLLGDGACRNIETQACSSHDCYLHTVSDLG